LGLFDEYIDFYYHSYHDIVAYSSFFRPKIKIEFDPIREQNTFAPQHTFQVGYVAKYTQRLLRVRVRNSGHRTLHNCQAELTVKIHDGDNSNKYPSDDAKPLAWGRHPQSMYDLTSVRNIQGHGSQLLHVVFSDSHFATTNVDAPRRYACISTIERLEYEKKELRSRGDTANNLTVEDSFTNGEFDIEIMITSDEGPFSYTEFRIHVESDFQKLSMKKIYPRRKLKII
jgi:hypothetical protein